MVGEQEVGEAEAGEAEAGEAGEAEAGTVGVAAGNLFRYYQAIFYAKI